jgi:two-component system LytT family response regulator
VKKIKVVIVDDERAARNILGSLLKMYYPEIEVVASDANVPDAVLSIKQHEPDLVFLDVEMPKYAGYEIVKFFDNIDFHMIFITAYEEFALKAFEVNAIDYLLKPIDRNRLFDSIDRFKIALESKAINANYKELLEELSEEDTRSVIYSESGKKSAIKNREVLAISAQGAYSLIHLINGKELTVSKNIGTLSESYQDDCNFYRSHKSWLVNCSHIESYSKSKETIKMSSGLVCKLSRFKKAEFETYYEKL